MNLPNLSPCPCGKPAVIVEDLRKPVPRYRAACPDVDCWAGPRKDTAKQAAEAWNETMDRIPKPQQPT